MDEVLETIRLTSALIIADSTIVEYMRQVQELKAEVAELRKPVAVEDNGQIEHWRACVRECPWTLEPRHFAELLCAYDNLKQAKVRSGGV